MWSIKRGKGKVTSGCVWLRKKERKVEMTERNVRECVHWTDATANGIL